WRESHAGEITDNLALSRFDVEQINARITLPIRHVGDFLRRRIESGRENQIVTAGQIAHGRAVLIHDGKALHAPVLRASLVDEYDPAVEITFLAGEPLV